MRRLIFLIALLALVVLALAACASQMQPEPVAFTIDMSEYAFNPNDIEVRVGQEVTLELVNNGALIHELMIGKDVMMMNNRPSGYQTDLFESTGVEPQVTVIEMHEHEPEHDEMMHSGFMIAVTEGGGKATMTFTITKDMVGEWEMGCFEQEGVHYDAGMKGKFTVLP